MKWMSSLTATRFVRVNLIIAVLLTAACTTTPPPSPDENIETFQSGNQKYNFMLLALKNKILSSDKKIFINVLDIENITNSPELQTNFAYIASTLITELQTNARFSSCQNCRPEVIDVFENNYKFQTFTLNGVLASSDEKGRRTEGNNIKFSASALDTSLFGGIEQDDSVESFQIEAALFLTGRHGESRAGLVVNNYIKTGRTTNDLEYYYLIGGTGQEKSLSKTLSQGLQYSANMLIKYSLIELIGRLYDFDYDRTEALYYQTAHSHIEPVRYSEQDFDAFIQELELP